MGKVESIFDYNPTERELRRFNLYSEEQIEEVKYLYSRYGDTDDCCRDSILYQLGFLFLMRKKPETADKYFSRMKDKGMLSTLVEDF
jgi:hypothetical protein